VNNLNRSRILLLAFIFSVAPQATPSQALTTAPQIAQDKESGYDRSFFKHWIDEDKDKCDTRAEVLISEAVVKPKVDKNCKITGGKWISAYDGKSVTNASLLDVDHLVPLAEAWRSGAWAWTPKQRQDFANDLTDKRALIAVTRTSNRTKSDKDIAMWGPEFKSCEYVQNWIAIKVRYSLTYDKKEAEALLRAFETCKFGDIPVQALPGYSYQSTGVVAPGWPAPIPTPKSPVAIVESGTNEAFTWVQINVTPYDYIPGINTQMQGFIEESESGISVLECFSNSKTGPNTFKSTYPIHSNLMSIFCKVRNNSTFKFYTEAIQISSGRVLNNTKSEIITVTVGTPPTPTVSASPTPTPTQQATASPVSPGAFCSPAGATGKSANGTAYTCKTSATDTRNRWRQ
jgi:hypothetical protein